jgi:hypothetical protein
MYRVLGSNKEQWMTAQEVLEKVARSMVGAGLYKDVATAIHALAVEQVERKIAAYQGKVQQFERTYGHSLAQHSRLLEGRASMAEEDEWMEWKGAQVMLEAWQQTLRVS